MRLKVLSKTGVRSYQIQKHLGEEFEVVKVLECKSSGNKHQESCFICPGYVQAPWMSIPNCWGFDGKLQFTVLKEPTIKREGGEARELESVVETTFGLEKEFKLKRLLRFIDE